MHTTAQFQSPGGHKRSAQEQTFDETSPTKVFVSHSGSTLKQQWRASHTTEPYSPHQQQYASPSGVQQQWPQQQASGRQAATAANWTSTGEYNAVTAHFAASTGHHISASNWQQAQTGAGSSGAQQQHQRQQQRCDPLVANNVHQLQQEQQQTPWQQQQRQQASQQASAQRQQQQVPPDSHHPLPWQLQPCLQQQYSPQQQQWQLQSPGFHIESNTYPQHQQWRSSVSPANTTWQQQQQPHSRGVALQQQQQQQQQRSMPSCQSPEQQVPAWQQQQQQQHPSGQQTPQQQWRQQQDLLSPPTWQKQQQQQPIHSSDGTPGNPAAPAAAGFNSGTALSPPAPSADTTIHCTTSAAAAAGPTPCSSSSSRPGGPIPSIWKLIRHSFQLQQAVVDHDIALLCSVLCLDEWHVRHEVARLNKWFRLTFWLRVVLEQWCVVDVVGPRTLLQLPHLPPQHVTLLDTWIREDMAAAAAAGGGDGGVPDGLCGDHSLTKYSSWTRSSGGGAFPEFGNLPPSWAITQLITMGRLKWVPAAATNNPAAAAAGPFTAACHGSYTWQHGPVDAWLCTDSSSSSEAAAARSIRAEQLRNMTHPRLQAKLLLDPTFRQQQQQHSSGLQSTSGSTSSSGVPNPLDASGSGVLELGFRSDDLTHPASCHLQRHPVLADHDRLLRVTISSKTGSGSSVDGGSALEDVLTHGVMLAGRRYRRLVQKDIGKSGESLWLLACESVCPEDNIGPQAWTSTNPAAARQMLGAFSSLPSISKQSARGALLVSNTLPLQMRAQHIMYIPDIMGPTDTKGNLLPQHQHMPTASSSTSGSDLVLSDGSGFMSADVSVLVPAVSAGEVLAADRGGGATWPGGPFQVRVFDPHYGGVIAKGTLTPLSVLPPQTILLRASQVKAPAAKQFWEKWSRHWGDVLVWAHQQHQRQEQQHFARVEPWQQQQQRVVRQPGQVAVLGVEQQRQQQLLEEVTNLSLQQGRSAAAAAAGVATGCLPPGQANSNHGSLRSHHQPVQQQQHNSQWNARSRATCSGSSTSSAGLMHEAADAAAAYCESRRPSLAFIHPQDRPWLQQLWWCDIEQQKLAGIDSSYDSAYAAAKAAGDIEVVHKLEALIGMQIKYPDFDNSSSSSSSTCATAAAGLSAIGFGGCLKQELEFKPDLALKQDLHEIKVRRRQKLALMSLPVPGAQDTAAAVAAGVIKAEGNTFSTPNAAGGIRLLGVPDPSCGAVPEGCVAVSPGLVPPTGQAVMYRDPGIHPGDVRRVCVIPYPHQLLMVLPPQFSGAMFLPTVGSHCLGASLAGGDYDGDMYLLLWDQRVLTWYRAQDPEPYVGPGAPACGSAAAGVAPQGGVSCSASGPSAAAVGGGGVGSGSKLDPWSVPEGCDWLYVEEKLTEYYKFCCRVSGIIGDAHTLWECYADKCGVNCGYCRDLVHAYYQALDAPKTGKEPLIPDYYRKNCMPGVDINKLPPWHSRIIKDGAKTAAKQPGGGARLSREWPAGSNGSRCIVRSLWSRLMDLSPVDYLDPGLLELDPDLVLQSGMCGVDMEALIDKWDRLFNEWNRSWAQIMRKADSACTRSEQLSLVDEKAELQATLKARFQIELLGGLEALAAAAAGGSISVSDRELLEASACYQAVYRRAKTKQDKLRNLTEHQRSQQKRDFGYEDMPRVAMAWRVAGQWLRMLKAIKPLRVQKALVMQGLLQGQTGGTARGIDVVQGLAGLHVGGLGRLGNSRLELGSVQHPYLAAIVAQQQSRRGQVRGFGGAAAGLAEGL